MAERFLIVRLSALGDVVCGLPVAVALREAYPRSEILWAVDPRFAGIPLCSTAISQVVLARKPSDIEPFGEFDAAIDLQGLLKSAAIVRRAKARLKVGYHWQREGSALFTRRVLPDPSSVHVVDQYVDVARALGATMERARFGIKPLAEDLLDMRTKLAAHGIDSQKLHPPIVILNAGAGWASKRWPASYFAEVARALHDRQIFAVFIGGKADADKQAFEEVRAAGAEHAISMLGETTVRELVSLIALGLAHVGGDTGSSHLAAALGVPAIGLYSITKSARSCPYGQRKRCLYDPRGLDRITSQEVIELLDQILETGPPDEEAERHSDGGGIELSTTASGQGGFRPDQAEFRSLLHRDDAPPVGGGPGPMPQEPDQDAVSSPLPDIGDES